VRHDEQIARTNAFLHEYLELHETALGGVDAGATRPSHGLSMRLALSCMVDADHADTAFFDTGSQLPDPPQGRWAERLLALKDYVRNLPSGKTHDERQRNQRRAQFFDACLQASTREAMVACEGPVGLGKTTAVAAYLIRRADEEGLRRLIVVAPYTNILSQTADVLRRALCLPGEQPEDVVVEHHHLADFEDRESRDIAALWRAPVVLTTAVSFFETLAACAPGSLRKLHGVPGSAIFFDESHAALPVRLWPQNWRWLRELTETWGCRCVFASGSLVRFWEDADIIDPAVMLPELLPPNQASDLAVAERARVTFALLAGGDVVTTTGLIDRVQAEPGPRLVILNTVQNAAVVGAAMRDRGLDVLHLSTALTPFDRGWVLDEIRRRMRGGAPDWVLVATSCVEAGVDLSFRCAFRERFATASLIQIGGRANRHGEYDHGGGSTVFDFVIEDVGITGHPDADVSADVLREFMATDELNRSAPASIVTRAMRAELERRGGLGADLLRKSEMARDYPGVHQHGRVIVADTRLVVVEPALKASLRARERIPFSDVLAGSVQLWARKIEKLALGELPGRPGLFEWNDAYEPRFLGYMAGVLRNEQFMRHGGAVI
jgi:CRISPR-associated endonuclease/helicase Cas3